MIKKGFFITFEGPEGSGKTTQIELLRDFLVSEGYAVTVTREPGGTEIGRKIRSILLDVENEGMHSRTELFLYAADRIEHVEKVILPAIRLGKIVLCDRYIDSTVAYQGAGRSIESVYIEDLMLMAVNRLMPELTLLLDINPEEGVKRAILKDAYKKSNGDRIEKESMEFHQKVRNRYLELASRYPERIKLVSAESDINTIHASIRKVVKQVLNA